MCRFFGLPYIKNNEQLSLKDATKMESVLIKRNVLFVRKSAVAHENLFLEDVNVNGLILESLLDLLTNFQTFRTIDVMDE